MTKLRGACYEHRLSLPLAGLQLTLFSAPHHGHGLRLARAADDRLQLVLNARNELDRSRFADDLLESMAESDAMRRLAALSREKAASAAEVGVVPPGRRASSGSLDSGLSLSRDPSPKS